MKKISKNYHDLGLIAILKYWIHYQQRKNTREGGHSSKCLGIRTGSD